MSKVSQNPRIGPEDLAGAPSWMLDNFLPFQNAFNADVYNRINGDIGLANLNDDIVVSKLTHGVEKIIKNPLWDTKRQRPLGIISIRTDGYPVAGQPIWRNISPDQIGVTVRFLPPESGSGSQGEVISSSTVTSVTLTSGVTANIVSLNATPGDYDASFVAMLSNGAGLTATVASTAVTSTSATIPANSQLGITRVDTPWLQTGNSDHAVVLPPTRITVSTTTTYFLVVRETFSAGTAKAYGRLSFVRAFPYLTGYQANVALRIMGG
jgi:hypothetical protein